MSGGTHTFGRPLVAAVSLSLVGCVPSTTLDERGIAAPAERYDAAIPSAYYRKTLEFTLSTAGFAPPVQSRAYAYMGIALYEAVRPGMADYNSIANQLNRNFDLPPKRDVVYHWPLAANAALAEVMRGLWGDATHNAADNIAAIDAMEAAFDTQYVGVPVAIRARSISYGREVGAAVFAGSLNDGGHRAYLVNMPPYTPPVGLGSGFHRPVKRHSCRTGTSTSSRS